MAKRDFLEQEMRPEKNGFEQAPRYLSQGEFAIGDARATPLTTILGSCVSACLFDPVRGVGGMNHFLLPEQPKGSVSAASFGAHAMELLINELIKAGAERRNLRAKVFGGARMISSASDVGRRNARFIQEFLAREAIDCVSHSLGGTTARKIIFWPESGRVRQKLLEQEPLVPIISPALEIPEIELF
ncbi:chemotaxis protein CheD [Pseudothioclava arenosa]|uniref:chemotaxis protein CheD n=1 Tax=Pseudothioclava arenosa TaxID=1795308 RepID=UPI0015CCD097|nr:chemotaxis protein CheD [Pseudothioclava arenosa]